MLRVVDEYWMEHIDAMEDLKQGIRLARLRSGRSRGGLQARGAEMFETMIAAIQDETVRRIHITWVKERVERKAVRPRSPASLAPGIARRHREEAAGAQEDQDRPQRSPASRQRP